jgi:TM2 domain-containing membrane protein YozV
MEQPRVAEPLKNPGIAAVLSFLFTGLGQIYNGQIGKGIAFIVVGFVCLALVIVLIGILLYPLFWIYNIYDAYTSAKGINAGTIRPD